MSEKQPKLRFEEEKERTATRSPPKKSKVEQSVPKKQKLKQDADKAAEKSQHLRFGKAEITPDEASRMTKQQKRATTRTATMWGAPPPTVCGTRASTFPKPKQSPATLFSLKERMIRRGKVMWASCVQ